MEEVSVDTTAVPWEDGPTGFKWKILRKAPDGRPRVALIKLEPGFEMGAHSHDLAENQYVLEGMYTAQAKEYPAGSYRYLPRHHAHGPVHSNAGALILVTWES